MKRWLKLSFKDLLEDLVRTGQQIKPPLSSTNKVDEYNVCTYYYKNANYFSFL